MTHEEHHRIHRIGWLRAAVLGANDGIVSTSSLIIGVASAGATKESILLAGVAGLVAGDVALFAKGPDDPGEAQLGLAQARGVPVNGWKREMHRGVIQ